jgi:hypothetical protein
VSQRRRVIPLLLVAGILAGLVIRPALAQEGAAEPHAQTNAPSAAESPNPAEQGPNGLPAADAAAIIDDVTKWLRQRDGEPQWALDDPAARAFTVDFYRRWLQPGAFDHPAEALRATQLEWMRSGDPVKADPQFWAPYVLVERG